MTFTCTRCCADTDNDCDICDECIEESRVERCTCLRRDVRHMDDPYSTPPILRKDPECEVHGRDPDHERDERIDRDLCK